MYAVSIIYYYGPYTYKVNVDEIPTLFAYNNL